MAVVRSDASATPLSTLLPLIAAPGVYTGHHQHRRHPHSRQTVTTTPVGRNHDGDSSTPVGVVDGECAPFAVLLIPAPSSPQRVKFSIYEGRARSWVGTLTRLLAPIWV